jgi:predicted NAD/FAD-dependent oxidoreductase
MWKIMKPKIAIIGAGIAGLACAYRLSKAGFPVEVFEKEEQPGGRMLSRIQGDKAYNLGALRFGEQYKEAFLLLKELELADRCILVDTHTFIHYLRDEKLFDGIPTFWNITRLSFLTIFQRLKLSGMLIWLIWKSRSLEFFDVKKPVKKWETISASDYLLKYLCKEAVDYLEALNSVTGYNLTDISLTRFLQQVNALFKNGDNYYSFNGNINLVAKELAKRVPIHTGCLIERLIVKKDKIHLYSSQGEHEYELAVIATDGLSARNLYANPTPAQERFLKPIAYVKAITAIYSVPLYPLKKVPITVVSPSTSSKIACFYCEYLDSLPYDQPIDQNKTHFLGVYAFNQHLNGQSDSQILEELKEELLRIYPAFRPVAKKVIPIEVKVWPSGAPRWLENSLERTQKFWQNGQGEQNVYFCGDYTNGPFVESSLRSGYMAAEKIMKST